MKKEELDRLQAKYLAGRTSISEERRLKEAADTDYFEPLKEAASEQMNWDFADFMKQVETPARGFSNAKIYSLLSGIAAMLIGGFFLIPSQMHPEKKTLVSQELTSQNSTVERRTILPTTTERQKRALTALVVTPKRTASSNTVQPQELVEDISSEVKAYPEEDFFVEVNGQRIYDEQQAIEVTETALHLVTSNLIKGFDSMENIKYLTIEL